MPVPNLHVTSRVNIVKSVKFLGLSSHLKMKHDSRLPVLSHSCMLESQNCMWNFKNNTRVLS